jgi:hypothetical protein
VEVVRKSDGDERERKRVWSWGGLGWTGVAPSIKRGAGWRESPKLKKG